MLPQRLIACHSLISYYSEKFNREITGVFVSYSEDNKTIYIKNSGEAIWIEWEKVSFIHRYSN